MFLSARYRPNIWPFWALIVLEFCLTVGLLALVGIAAPNLYRTKLWSDGAENGFNSSPKAGMYAAANYRPYKTPRVWSQFITNYNLVIVVLSMFLMLVKSIMYILHVLPPIMNCVLHLVLAIMYIVSIYYQASSDTTDPRALQTGPPWYITKPCSAAKHHSNIGYCQQAKATFGCFLAMLMIFLAYFGFALFSCFPSKEHQLEYAEKQRLKREKYPSLYQSEDDEATSKNAASMGYAIPETPGLENLNPMTPRTFAFNKLSGTKNQTLHQKPAEPTAKRTARFPLRSSFAKSKQPDVSETEMQDGIAESSDGQMYFPPPPKAGK